ncbi:BLUF domain-containing protein [Grimontia sp. SpTr1]|uniref:BLUF domain-containing protein n=1 Tax=Grimontia sp. SpTr1 TaxID=2995319 RepID=UPI00248B30FE|nr:BLUF domain-containing protein [Grimontia sp. SpTr1]
MIRLIYASSATVEFTESKLMQLLGKSRQNNGQLAVSGLLLYAKGNFFQVLEGEEHNVDKLYQKIEQDDRHNRVVVLDRSEIKKRAFPDWSMGFRNLETFDKSQLRGYNDFLDRDLSAEEFGEMGDEIVGLIDHFRSIC